jgi:hypothetical protein
MKLSNINFHREAWWLIVLATLVPLAGLAALLFFRARLAG